MREHKYRAWHKKEKRMIEPVIQIHLGYMPYIGWYETEHDALEGNLTTAFLDEVELMDGTGMPDKNGKEIYEGDVVEGLYKEPFSNKEKQTICVVRWDVSGYWTFDGGRRFLGGYLSDLRDVRIISNVWENGGLLDDRKDTKTY